MLSYDIPGYGRLQIENVVFDFNGTLVSDGRISAKVKDRLNLLAKKTNVVIVTSDTRGNVREIFKKIKVNIKIIEGEDSSKKKEALIEELGSDKTVAVGNGRNDHLMLRKALFSICVIDKEGSYSKSLMNADVIVKSPLDAIDFLLKPLRIIATLRD
ncbi:MAG: HAD family hydrolase [Deltaproteobacteria bacterium]|nr:HAD family hydrolase [Deltaproteobacteria bacterium]